LLKVHVLHTHSNNSNGSLGAIKLLGTVVGNEAMKETRKSAVEEEDVETSRKPGIMRLKKKKMKMRRKISQKSIIAQNNT